MLKVQNRHIDWTQHQIAIPAAHAKSGKTRRVPFDPSGRLAQVLKKRRFLAPSAYVFSSEGGTFVGSVRTAWESPLLMANGRPTAPGRGKKRVNRYALDQIDLRWHDIRHECASRWLEQGVDLRTIQLLLGHSKVATTERYPNVTDEEIRRSMQEKVWRVGRAKGA